MLPIPHRTKGLIVGRLIAATAILFCTVFAPSWAFLASDYQASAGFATFTPLVGGTNVIGPTPSGPTTAGSYNDQATSGTLNIGFNFIYECAVYTQFSVNTSGLVILGTTTSGSYANNLTSPPTYPILAPFWQQMSTLDGTHQATPCNPPVNTGVSYQVSGTAPNRVLTIEWRTNLVNSLGYWSFTCPTAAMFFQFQTRLYEGTNRIEYHYGAMWAAAGQATAASIGMAAGSGNFFSLTPSGGTSATLSATVANNAVALHLTPITNGTIYAFTPCYFRPVGITGAGGGTVSMADGDTLINRSYVYGSTPASFTPFSLTLPSGSCATRNYSIVISGAAASDYMFQSSGTQTISGSLAAGGSITPVINFTPGGVDVREAILKITDLANGCSRSYRIRAVVTPRVVLTGNISQGGTSTMASGDVLLNGFQVVVGNPQTFTPFAATNISTGASADITYSITGGNGQYSILPTSASIPALGSNTPQITFSPLPGRSGPQPATLTVAVDKQVYTFTLNASASTRALTVSIAGKALDSASSLFTNMFSCVGDMATFYTVDLENPSAVPVVINGLDFLVTDTLYGQGVPRYAVRRDKSGRPIPIGDYFLSLAPPLSPASANPMATFPIELAPQTSRRMYLCFAGARPEKRFGRMYMRTNALNHTSADTNGVMTTGLLRADLYGRGVGSRLSDNMLGGLPKALLFKTIRVGEWADTTLVIANPGLCSLRISSAALAINAGDVDEFRILRSFHASVDSATGDLLIPPSSSDTLVLRFSPRREGSRRATLRLVSNDSTIALDGISERGTYYIDLYGRGFADLYASSHDFGTALIGGGAADHRRGIVYLRNTTSRPVYLGELRIVGPDAGEFSEDVDQRWPHLPYLLMAGEELGLSVVFAPVAGGVEGSRVGHLEIVSSGGDTTVSDLRGSGGSRRIELDVSELDFGMVSVGKSVRRRVHIRNAGTMELHVFQGKVGGAESGIFHVSRLEREVLRGGQVESVEVTYTPRTSGRTSGVLEIESNGVNGVQEVLLNGVSLQGFGGRGDWVWGDGVELGEQDRGGGVASGVSRGVEGSGLWLGTSLPNPARDRVEIVYGTSHGGKVRIAVYNLSGALVLEAGEMIVSAGEHRVGLDLRTLPSGAYYYRVESGDQVAIGRLDVVK